jgi:flagellin-like protein
MSAKAKRIERSQRFKRAWRGENRQKAVSPVVATLILILVAVAAAAALYLWLVAWQGGVTGGIGNPSAQYTVSIGGSTSVYPFAEIAATQFEQNNSDVVVSVNQGGSGAGMAAVCSGQVNIGEASAFYSASSLESADGCPATLNEQIVAYDGVDAITPTANVHGLQSMSWDTLQAVYETASSTAPTSGITSTDGYLAGSYHMDGFTAPIQTAQATSYAWDQIPACAEAAASCAGTGSAEAAPLAAAPPGTYSATYVAGDYGPCNVAATGGSAADLCSYGTAAGTLGVLATGGATPCGFNICAGGTGPGTNSGEFGATIQTAYRSDVSGTQQSFLARLLAVGTPNTGTTLSVGFSGCSGDNQWDGCGMSLSTSNSHGENGNPAVISYVAATPDAIGFASDGLAQESTSGVTPINFQGFGQTVVVTVAGESNALGAIAKGIADYDGGIAAYSSTQAYIGWRPFLNVETAPPTGEVLRYLEFVFDPANNENFAAQSAEISVYASGLAGVVPVTPITGYQVTV